MDELDNYGVLSTNNLDVKLFERLLSNNDQGYKFYWLEAIMRLIPSGRRVLSFEDIVNEMIWEAWKTVTYYNLRLGHTVNGNPENFLEHAIRTLEACSKEERANRNVSREMIISLIKKYDEKLITDKLHLTDYVPYRIIKPFVDKEGKEYIDKKQYGRFIAYLSEFNRINNNYFYTIIEASSPLYRCVSLNEQWYDFMIRNYAVIMGWIQYSKAHFVQDRNPDVPRVIDKISPESDEARKSLENARNLWISTVELTGKPLYEIYTGKEISLNEFDLDHFVPWSYVSNDELWNLIPMSKKLNCSKNNKLPEKKYLSEMINYQFYLYGLIFNNNSIEQTTKLMQLFEKCKKQHLNADWALRDLYVSGKSYKSFKYVLGKKLGNIYDAAKMQEYEIWEF